MAGRDLQGLGRGTDAVSLSDVIDAGAMTTRQGFVEVRHHYYQVAEDLFCDLWFRLDEVSQGEAAKIVGSLVLGGSETPSPDGRRSLTCLPVQAGGQAGMRWFLWDVSSGGGRFWARRTRWALTWPCLSGPPMGLGRR